METEDDDNRSRAEGAKGKKRTKHAEEDEDYRNETDDDNDTHNDNDTHDDSGTPKRAKGEKHTKSQKKTKRVNKDEQNDPDGESETPKRTKGKKKKKKKKEQVEEGTAEKDGDDSEMAEAAKGKKKRKRVEEGEDDETTKPSEGKKKKTRVEDRVSFFTKILTDILPFFKSPKYCYNAIASVYNGKPKRSLLTVWQNKSPFLEWCSPGQPFDGYTLCYTVDTNTEKGNVEANRKDDMTGPSLYNFGVFRREVLMYGEMFEFLKEDMTAQRCDTSEHDKDHFELHLIPAVIKFCSPETLHDDLVFWNRYSDYLVVTNECFNGQARPDDCRTCCAIEHLGLGTKESKEIVEFANKMIRRENATLDATVAIVASYFRANPTGVQLLEGPVFGFPGAFRFTPVEPEPEPLNSHWFTEGNQMKVVEEGQKKAARSN